MNDATTTLTWTDGHGKEQTRTVKHTLDLREYVGTPGYAMLLVAANTDLTVPAIERFFRTAGIGRSANWIRRRRWLFQQPGTVNVGGTQCNTDGRGPDAVRIMREHPTMSVRKLVVILKGHGITRSRMWVFAHRCD